MGSLISREGSESKIIADLMNAINYTVQKTNSEATDSNEVLPFDPRSPSTDFDRTPIQVFQFSLEVLLELTYVLHLIVKLCRFPNRTLVMRRKVWIL